MSARIYRADAITRLQGRDPAPPVPRWTPDPARAAVILPASRWTRPGRAPITLDDAARWPVVPAPDWWAGRHGRPERDDLPF